MGVRYFNVPAGVDPLRIFGRAIFTSSETRRIVLPDTENRTIVFSFVWTQYRNVTNRRTDRHTEMV